MQNLKDLDDASAALQCGIPKVEKNNRCGNNNLDDESRKWESNKRCANNKILQPSIHTFTENVIRDSVQADLKMSHIISLLGECLFFESIFFWQRLSTEMYKTESPRNSSVLIEHMVPTIKQDHMKILKLLLELPHWRQVKIYKQVVENDDVTRGALTHAIFLVFQLVTTKEFENIYEISRHCNVTIRTLYVPTKCIVELIVATLGECLHIASAEDDNSQIIKPTLETEAVLFEQEHAVTIKGKLPKKNDDRSSVDNEAGEDEASSYTFNGKCYATYQDMAKAKRKRQDSLEQSGLLNYSKRPHSDPANSHKSKRKQTTVSREPTRCSKRLSGLNRVDYNENSTNTESGDDEIDRREEGEMEVHALKHIEQDRLNEDRSQTQKASEGNTPVELLEHRAKNGVERDILSEQERGQKTYVGSNNRPQINSNIIGDNQSKTGGGKDDDASGIASGDEQQFTFQMNSVEEIEVETAHCDDSCWEGAYQRSVFTSEKDDHEVSEEERKSCAFGHREGMAFSEREAGDTSKVGGINPPNEVELHGGSVQESEGMIYMSKEDAEHYKLQIQQMKERNSALEEAAKRRENSLRLNLSEQMKTVANLRAQLDRVTEEKREAEKRRVQDGKEWNKERKRMESQLQEMMNMKCRHDEALAKEVAEKNRVQKQLDALLAKKQKEVCSEESATLRTDSSSRYPSRHRSYETRSRFQQSGVGSTSAAIDQTSPPKKQASGSRNSKSNPRGSLVTIKDGGFVGESRRKTARESKKGEIINAKLRAELLDVLASTKNISKVSLDDIIGQEVAKKAMLELKPFLDPEYACLYADDEDSEEDSKSNTGILLFGPPGTGKTMFAKAMASNGGCIFFKISPDDILRKHVGESEERMRGFFLIAKEKAVETGKTAVLFIDECDRLFKEPGNNDCEVTGNITGIFQECMNGITEPKGQLIFLGATNYKEKLPSPILSRFAIKIPINLPDREERIAIAKRNMTSIHSLTDDEFDQFAEMTDGYSGRDIYNLIKRGAEPSRKLEAKEHSGAWCKNNNDCYVPCFHSPDHPCRAKERGTFREIKKRTKTEKVRPRLLALKHIEMGINLLGRPEQMFQE